MIKVIERKDEPRAIITCNNCQSVLEYGNCDLSAHTYTPSSISYLGERIVDYYYFNCPVCNCEIKVSKFIQKG